MNPTKNSTLSNFVQNFDRHVYSLRPLFGRESPSNLLVKDKQEDESNQPTIGSVNNNNKISLVTNEEQKERTMGGNQISKQKVETKNFTELTDHQVDMLIESTKLSAHQVRQWHQSFIHECPSGKLDRKRFIEVYQQFYPQGRGSKLCSLAFKAFDRDHNGFVDFHEFLIAISLTMSADPRDRLSLAFDMYDINGDGRLDKREISHILTLIYEVNRHGNLKDDEIKADLRARQIIEQFDLDGDRKLSREEFINGCLNNSEIRKLLIS